MKLVITSSKIISDDWTLFIQDRWWKIMSPEGSSLSLYVNKFNL